MTGAMEVVKENAMRRGERRRDETRGSVCNGERHRNLGQGGGGGQADSRIRRNRGCSRGRRET
jgi:hypothetical protein